MAINFLSIQRSSGLFLSVNVVICVSSAFLCPCKAPFIFSLLI